MHPSTRTPSRNQTIGSIVLVPTCGRSTVRRLATTAAVSLAAASAVLLSGCAGSASRTGDGPSATAAARSMTFFVGANPGRGGDLGGLSGADAQCQRLASAVGAGHRAWRAYLSTQATASAPAVNARDRIGKGPWQNAHGQVVAQDLAQLHGVNSISKQTAVDEQGRTVKGRGDTPNEHDILTGSQPDGTAIAGDVNSTCANWTQSEGGAAMVGHHDRIGLNESAPMKSWNSSHLTRGCSLPQLAQSGSSGKLYCFAVN